MNIKRVFFFGLLFLPLLLNNSVSAQIIKLDLDESIRIASDSSLQAYINQNRYLSSYWAFRAFKAGRLPSVSLKTTPVRYNRDFTRRYDSEENIDIYKQQQSLNSYGNLSVSQNFDLTGGTFFVDSELGYSRNFGDNNYTQFNTVPIRIGYYQSLFGFNSFKWDKKIEPLKFDKAQKKYLYSREEISETVISYFFDLAMAQMEYNMAVETVASSDTLYRIGQNRQEIAAISQADLLTLKLDVVNARNSLSNAQTGQKRSEFSFIKYLNLPTDAILNLDIPQKPKEVFISVETALEYARRNNPYYLEYKQELLESEREVERTKKTSNFDASFSISVGFNQVSDNFRNSYRKPSQQEIISIGLTIPILDWGVKKGRANMARNNLNVEKLSIKQKEQSLEQDIILTVNDFNIQQSLIATAEEALELATLAYQTTKQRFIIGKADLNSLTLALNRQNNAQRNYINSLRNYWLSYFKLRKLTLYDFIEERVLSVDFEDLNKKAY